MFNCLGGGMVDTGDLKSPACKGVRVRVPPEAPLIKAGIAQLVEHRVANAKVAGSNPVSRSTLKTSFLVLRASGANDVFLG